MSQIGKPLLITGLHRSGTTWVGKVLGLSPQIRYVQEPFNLGISKGNGLNHDNWYTFYPPEADSPKLIRRAEEAFGMRLDVKERLSGSKNPLTIYRKLRFIQRFRSENRKGIRPLLKDPMAFYSAPWIARRFEAEVVVIVRHPAAFISSIKRMGWTFDFRHMIRQEALMGGPLKDFREAAEKNIAEEHDLIDDGILLWNMAAATTLRYRREYPDWIFKKHEELSENPVRRFRGLFEMLDICFTQEIEKEIRRMSGRHNPAEVSNKEQLHQLNRDSRSNIKTWQQRLSKNEIERIRKGTEAFADKFYADSDWH